MARALVTVIATAGRPDLLRRTLNSLAVCELPPIYRGAVVVENGPKRGAEEVVSSCDPRLSARYLYQAEGNKSLALNAALDQVGDALIFFTDDDVRFHPGTLRAYAEAAEGRDGGHFYGGPTGVDYEAEPPDWLKAYLPSSARGRSLGDEMKPVGGADFLGYNWAAFAADLRAVGGFDPAKGPGAPTRSTGQERDGQLRLLAAGVRGIYVPQAMVWHFVPAERCTSGWALRRIYRGGVEIGLDSDAQTAMLLGRPRWVLKACARLGAEYLYRKALRDRAAAFESLSHLSRHLGYMRGVRLGRRLRGPRHGRRAPGAA